MLSQTSPLARWPLGPIKNPPPFPGGYPTFTRMPFMAWNKLEGRQRMNGISEALKAEIYDPLWMMARQWQMGELRGEDVGSAFIAKIAYQSTRPSHFIKGPNKLSPIPDDELCFSKNAQAIPFELTIQQRAHIGTYLVKQLKADTLVTISDIRNVILHLDFQIPNIPSAHWDLEMDKMRFHADQQQYAILRSYQGRIPDGIQVLQMFSNSTYTTWTDISAETQSRLQTISVSFISWVIALYPHLIDGNTSWKTSSMGHSFKMAFPKLNQDNTVSHLVLGNDSLSDEQPDWFSADALPSDIVTINSPVTEPDLGNYVTQKAYPVFLSRARFDGMPASRYWEMEDGRIDLGNVEGDMSESIKQILAEFATVYSNDWFIIPFNRKENELASIHGIVIKDTFGQYSLITNALSQAGSNNFTDDDSEAYGWNMFHHSMIPGQTDIVDNQVGKSMQSGFVSGSSRIAARSEILEKVEFIRDEMDNRVWAVETSIASPFAGSVPGKIYSDQLTDYIRKHSGINPDISAESSTPLQYQLSNVVPENYIPFIPVRSITGTGEFSNRQIALQRGWLPRLISNGNNSQRVRPRTMLLREGIHANDELATEDVNGTQKPIRFLLHEELIPRSGISVSDRYYYTRTSDGKIHLWRGRSVSHGTEASSAKLDFDHVSVKKPQQ